MHTFTVRSIVAPAVAALLVAVGASNALADPGFTPDSNDAVGVGSDTTELVMNALATEYNRSGQVVASRRLASFDATGSSSIVPRAGAASITRPSGSSAGIDALQATASLTFARSSRGPNNATDKGTVFYPYANDKLSYIYAKPTSSASTRLTAADLRAIYTCAKTNWNQFGGANKLIQARIPGAGSGTRAFFLTSIGVTEQQIVAAIAQPNTRCDVAEVRENDPRAVIGKSAAIAPFSVARYTTLSTSDKSKVALASRAPFAPTRVVYNVLRANGVQAFGPLFNQRSWICTSTKAGQVIAAQGFTRLPASTCGVGVRVP
jgi:ABC-type phosphate transport system substrate-binding protein